MKLPIKSCWTACAFIAALGCGEEQTAGPATPGPSNPPKVIKATVGPAGRGVPGYPQPAASETSKAQAQPKGSSESGPKSDEGPKVEGPEGEKSKPGATTTGLSADQLARIRELPAEDQELAIKQKLCPVSGEPLGEMGKPVKVSAEGRSFFLCCKSCEKDVKADPKAVLAKLDNK